MRNNILIVYLQKVRTILKNIAFVDNRDDKLFKRYVLKLPFFECVTKNITSSAKRSEKNRSGHDRSA